MDFSQLLEFDPFFCPAFITVKKMRSKSTAFSYLEFGAAFTTFCYKLSSQSFSPLSSFSLVA
jgi:hypothetical protein